MSMIDKFLDAMRLNPDEDYDDDEYEYDDYDDYDDEDEGPSPRELKRQAAAEAKEARRLEKQREKEEARERQAARREEKPARQPASSRNTDRFDSSFDAKPAKAQKTAPEKVERGGRSQSKITSIDKAPRRAAAAGMEVCVIKPTSIEDELEIADTLLDGRTVILNMEGFDISVAQRIIDFTSGSTYAIGGRLQKVSSFIFLATPRGVDISGDISNIMENFEANGYDY